MKIVFLGSGGSRHMVMTQERRTGGLLFDLEKVKFIVDPGPGSIVNALSIGIDPSKLDGVVLSHIHIDHSTDANVYLDAIEKPFVIAEEHCLVHKKDFEGYPCITLFHQKKSEVHAVKPGDKVSVKGVSFTTVKTKHYDPSAAYRISYGDIDIGYVADGAYYKGLEKQFEGCKVLIFNVIIPKGQEAKIDAYMSIDGMISFLNALQQKPKLVVLSHLSTWMVRSNLWKQEKILQEATKIRNIIHAEDFMSLDLKTLQTSTVKNDREKLKL